MTGFVKEVSSVAITAEKGLAASKYIPDPKKIADTLVKEWIHDFSYSLLNFNSDSLKALRKRIEEAILSAMRSDTKVVGGCDGEGRK